MRREPEPWRIVLAAALVCATAAGAEGFPWDRIVGFDVGSLSADQRTRVETLAGSTANYHGCRGSVTECLAADPADPTARRLAGYLARRVVAGDTDAQVAEGVANRRRSAHPARPAELDLFEAHCRGPEAAAVTLVEFGDYECPYCRSAEAFVERVVDARSDTLRFCFKQFPVRSHERAVPAALAALASAAQGRFWEMHRALYAASDLSDSGLEGVARAVGLDLERYRAALTDEAPTEEIEADKLEGQELGVDRTPTFFVNGKRYFGELTEIELADRVDEEFEVR
ncbi:MAG: thioredoxin domain-containing protein [Deltaproteobacteria bacterium]|nr:thioredoxin domain-containing protein [Deltaproteobacteria bacterium]